jgi:hypothetical protein
MGPDHILKVIYEQCVDDSAAHSPNCRDGLGSGFLRYLHTKTIGCFSSAAASRKDCNSVDL